MPDDKKKDPQDEEIVVVEVDGKGKAIKADEEDSSDEDKTKKKKLGAKGDSSDEDGTDDDADEEDGEEEPDSKGDERIGREDTEAETNRRDARRRERQETKRRRNEARDRNKRELEFLRRRNEQLERRFSDIEVRTGSNELLAISQRIDSVKASIKTAEEVMAESVKKGEGNDLVEATIIRDELTQSLNQLLQARHQSEQQARSPARPPDPELVSHAEDWRSENPWWTPGGRDPDSKTVSAIDNALMREGGYDPTTQDYWDELTRRVRKRLPHKFEGENGNGRGRTHDDNEDDGEQEEKDDTRRKGGSGPKFSTGGRERPLRKNEVYVNPERKAALMELGVWEDPVLRKKYLKRYQEYDREHSATRN